MELPESEDKNLLTFYTNKQNYIPGETVSITATTEELVDFEALEYVVLNPDGDQIFEGSLFPTSDKEYQFFTTIFLDTVSPVYGTYQIIGDYSTQRDIHTFTITEDLKEDKPISLWTDKEVYRLGDKVIITGRLNEVWINAMDLEVLQTGDTSLGGRGFAGGDFIYKITDVVRIEGDGSFLYEFKIPTGSEFLGDYRVKVSKEIGEETIFFTVSENPETFVKSEEVFSIFTDREIYSLGDPISIFGKINEIQESSSFGTPVVDISIKKDDGSSIISTTFKPSANDPLFTTYSLTAVPDIVGNYKVDDAVKRGIFETGLYNLKASYADGKFSASTSFVVIDPLDLGDDAYLLTLDKEVYGFGETVHLTGFTSVTAQVPSVVISLVEPDGDTSSTSKQIEEGKFEWSWKTPREDTTAFSKTEDERSIIRSNLGIYKIIVAAEGGKAEIFFKLSEDPENDSLLGTEPLIISTDKSLYKTGENFRVNGLVQKRTQGSEGLVIPDRVQIKVMTKSFPQTEIYESFATPDQGGHFFKFVHNPGRCI